MTIDFGVCRDCGGTSFRLERKCDVTSYDDLPNRRKIQHGECVRCGTLTGRLITVDPYGNIVAVGRGYSTASQ